jgi:hypothetical protein
MARLPQGLDAMEKASMGAVEPVVIKEDVVSEKGGSRKNKREQNHAKKKKPFNPWEERFF